MDIKQKIIIGKTALGIEFGSTRIKAVLIDDNHQVIATGSYDWQNQFENNIWTYSLDTVKIGLQESYKELSQNVLKKYDIKLSTIGAIGISAMMHGYLVFDKDNELLVPFRTWRNTITEQSADVLTELFNFNIPQRWSIAHLYQAILNNEEHIGEIDFMTTLAGYVHWQLTGEKVIGIDDASGIFPVNIKGEYDKEKIKAFDNLIGEKNLSWKLNDILPKVLPAGANAGFLTAEGARLLDPSGELKAGIPLCPPEGDAGTGMVATNSILKGTGNVSAGTSIFAMIVLNKELSGCYREIDVVSTPDGNPVAMVHCNNCCSDIDAWINVFGQLLDGFGLQYKKSELYDIFYNSALTGEFDCGGVVTHNFFSGEPVANLANGKPMVMRKPDANFTFSNFARSLIYSSFAMLKYGMDILTQKENVTIDKLLGHGGLFKAEGVAQQFMASALSVPVSVMPSAAEGGAWGIAVLAAYMNNKSDNELLSEYLSNNVFAQVPVKTLEVNEEESCGFRRYMKEYVKGVELQKSNALH